MNPDGTYMQAVFFIWFLLLMPVLLYAFLLFDRLVRYEYEMQRVAWEADGKPVGFYWRPKEHRWFRISSHLATLRLTLVWLFRTRSWVAQSQTPRKWLHLHRLCVLIWNVGLVIFVIVLCLAM